MWNPFKKKIQLPVVKSVDQILGQFNQAVKDLEETKAHHETLAASKTKHIETLQAQISDHNSHADRAAKVVDNIKALIAV